MAIPPIFIQLLGIILFGFSVRSIVKHFKKESKEAKEAPNQSKFERRLNAAILYVWFVFIILFTLGMVVNNNTF